MCVTDKGLKEDINYCVLYQIYIQHEIVSVCIIFGSHHCHSPLCLLATRKMRVGGKSL